MIEKVLLSSGAKHANDVLGSTHMATASTVSQINNAHITASQNNLHHRLKLEWIEKKIASLMIVATLISIVSLTNFISPSGGVCKTLKSSCFIILLLISGLPIGCRYLVWILMVISWISITSMVFSVVIASGVLIVNIVG